VEELEHAVARDDQETVGLGAGRAELGDELGRRHPDRTGQALLLGHPPADQRGDLRGRAEQPPGAADVEEGLVAGQRLDQRGDVAEDRHDRTGRGADRRAVDR
jgi:hypothetical protein